MHMSIDANQYNGGASTNVYMDGSRCTQSNKVCSQSKHFETDSYLLLFFRITGNSVLGERRTVNSEWHTRVCSFVLLSSSRHYYLLHFSSNNQPLTSNNRINESCAVQFLSYLTLKDFLFANIKNKLRGPQFSSTK